MRCPTVVVSSGRQHRPDKLRKCRVAGARRASEKFLQGSQLGRFVVRQERRVEFTNESRGIDVPLRSFSDGRH